MVVCDDEMVKLTFYGGVNEIGGNKVLLEDRETRVFLDFGQSFTLGADYFTGWLGPRAINGVGDHFEFNLLPKIKISNTIRNNIFRFHVFGLVRGPNPPL
jgi:mRNA degradation ribonuclease J1/J2